MLRVIAGKYKGRTIDQPPSTITRPTKDRVKEAFFSMIQFHIEGSIVLDVYSGSGALAIESSSRGAAKVVALDKNIVPVNVIKKNIEKLGIENIDILHRNCVDYLSSVKGLKFGIIILDPPFASYDELNNVLEIISENKLLKDTGHMIIETDNYSKIKLPKTFVEIKNKKYGKSIVLLITNNI